MAIIPKIEPLDYGSNEFEFLGAMSSTGPVKSEIKQEIPQIMENDGCRNEDISDNTDLLNCGTPQEDITIALASPRRTRTEVKFKSKLRLRKKVNYSEFNSEIGCDDIEKVRKVPRDGPEKARKMPRVEPEEVRKVPRYKFFKCAICHADYFKTQIGLETHMEWHRRKNGVVEKKSNVAKTANCELKSEIGNESEVFVLPEHVEVPNNPVYKCPICEKNPFFTTLFGFNRHMGWHRAKRTKRRQRYLADKNKKAQKKETFVEENAPMAKIPKECEICGDNYFKTKIGFELHMAWHRAKNKNR